MAQPGAAITNIRNSEVWLLVARTMPYASRNGSVRFHNNQRPGLANRNIVWAEPPDGHVEGATSIQALEVLVKRTPPGSDVLSMRRQKHSGIVPMRRPNGWILPAWIITHPCLIATDATRAQA